MTTLQLIFIIFATILTIIITPAKSDENVNAMTPSEEILALEKALAEVNSLETLHAAELAELKENHDVGILGDPSGTEETEAASSVRYEKELVLVNLKANLTAMKFEKTIKELQIALDAANEKHAGIDASVKQVQIADERTGSLPSKPSNKRQRVEEDDDDDNENLLVVIHKEIAEAYRHIRITPAPLTVSIFDRPTVNIKEVDRTITSSPSPAHAATKLAHFFLDVSFIDRWFCLKDVIDNDEDEKSLEPIFPSIMTICYMHSRNSCIIVRVTIINERRWLQFSKLAP
ncbi:hypothetical protein QQS21_007705 [Conoideocrella luteorostrata]|uniref:Uncharacterized protein n=1 Tax=Conoideocrella luteorostrata TaxID=1105319 RepID=A0AAJ0CK64_9HYPO|nr:hypothetical protein QQS21_007705 [Conoideocrella luteorostrata]